jgi:adenine-specific DNA-methyltransferase
LKKNILIKGDSIDILNTINQEHKVDMIYIDPPYNTNRKDITYEDNRSDEEFVDLLKNTLSLSYPMLNDSGSIFVSISGKNLHIVRNVLDEVYGKKNYEATMIRLENAKKQKIGKVSLKENYEYVVVYTKNQKNKKFYLMEHQGYSKYKKSLIDLKKHIGDEYIKNYIDLKTIDKIDLKTMKMLKSIWEIQENNQGLKQYQYIIDNEVYRAADINMYLGRGNKYNLIHPLTNKICKNPKYDYPLHTKFDENWKLVDGNLIFSGKINYISEDKIGCGNIILGINEIKIPDFANRLDIDTIPDTLLNITGSDDRMLTKLFDGQKVFDYPKPVKLLEYLISIGTTKGDTVLDFFAGSGTTGEASNNLDRNFLLIQRDEVIDTIKLKDKEINSIFEITKERLIRKNIDFIQK